jgi:hypothetical protein
VSKITTVEEFLNTLTNALAEEMSMLRAPRDQWEAAAKGVMSKMNIRGLPTIKTQALGVAGGYVVMFDHQNARQPPAIGDMPPTIPVEQQTWSPDD